MRGAELLAPIFEQTQGKKGRLSIQTNPDYYRTTDALARAGAPLCQARAEHAGEDSRRPPRDRAIEEVTAQGVSINATVCFTVPQAVAVAEAVERGLKRREDAGLPTSSIVSVCTIMVGRLDDWMKVCAEKRRVWCPRRERWTGRALLASRTRTQIFNKRGYRTRPLGCRLPQPSALVGAHRRRRRADDPVGVAAKVQRVGIEVTPRIDDPVPAELRQRALRALPGLPQRLRARRPQARGVRLLRRDGAHAAAPLISSYRDLTETVRDLMLPNPD